VFWCWKLNPDCLVIHVKEGSVLIQERTGVLLLDPIMIAIKRKKRGARRSPRASLVCALDLGIDRGVLLRSDQFWSPGSCQSIRVYKKKENSSRSLDPRHVLWSSEASDRSPTRASLASPDHRHPPRLCACVASLLLIQS
jgi:hypothetical protein